VTTTGFALHLAGVRKTFRPGNAAPITAVDNASLDLATGDTAAHTGTIEVGGTDITGLGRGRLAAYRATIGVVFHLLPALSARDNVIAPALPRRRHLSFDPATGAEIIDFAASDPGRASTATPR
jgi:putative ABC transport system ATP-binding protein